MQVIHQKENNIDRNEIGNADAERRYQRMNDNNDLITALIVNDRNTIQPVYGMVCDKDTTTAICKFHVDTRVSYL